EPQVAVNPTNRANIAVASWDGLRVSTDYGATFSNQSGHSFGDPYTHYPRAEFHIPAAGDTAMTFDSAGRLYWMSMDGVDDPGINGLSRGLTITQVNPTTGAIIPGTKHAVDGANFAIHQKDDKPWLAAGPDNSLYAVWIHFELDHANTDPDHTQVMISRSLDRGATWSTPLRLDNGQDGFTWPPTVTVANDGRVYVAYHSQTGFTPNTPGHPGTPDGVSGKVVVVRLNTGLDPTSAVR